MTKLGFICILNIVKVKVRYFFRIKKIRWCPKYNRWGLTEGSVPHGCLVSKDQKNGGRNDYDHRQTGICKDQNPSVYIHCESHIFSYPHFEPLGLHSNPHPPNPHNPTHKKNLIFFFLTQKDTIFCFFSFQYYQPTISSLLISSFFLAFFLNITTRKNGYCSQCCSDTPFL